VIYLSSNADYPEELSNLFGVMFSANRRTGGLRQKLARGDLWALDNNAFTGKFDSGRWVSSLQYNTDFADSCVLVSIPDALGDSRKTVKMFYKYRHLVTNYPAALVTQDGMTPELVPWADINVLFIGGTDAHKLGPEASILIAAANEREVPVHVGRVNSTKRIRQFAGCASSDGTHFRFVPKYKREKEYVRFAEVLKLC